VTEFTKLQRLRAWGVNTGRKRLELTGCAVMSVALIAIGDRAWHPQTRYLNVAVLEQPERTCDFSLDHATVVNRLKALEKDESLKDFSLQLRPFRVCLGRDLEAKDWLWSAFIHVAHSGNLRSVRWLFEVHDYPAETLSVAMAKADRHSQVIDFLKSKGAQDPSLAVAAQHHASNAMGRILERSQLSASELTPALASYIASYTTTDANGETMDDSAKTVLGAQALMAKGALVNGDVIAALCGQEKALTDPLLDLALAHREPGAIETALGQMWMEVPEALVRRVTSEGIDWGYHDGEDDAPMPLVKAVQAHNERVVRVLLELKAPVDRSYKSGANALQASLACSEGDGGCERITEMLLAQGANPNKRFLDGTTPLFVASESGTGRQTRALLEHGAHMEDRVVRETALDAAERVGNTTVARILSAHGAHLSPQTNGQFGR
jgi:Ankyrin repeats (3 copies)